MARSTKTQKALNLNAAHGLLSRGISVAEAATILAQERGLSRRQAYRYLEHARAITLQARLAECQLEMHPTKTKIVYCKDGKRKGRHSNVMFDFLGYQFRPRMVQNSRDGSLFCGFVPAVSPSALKSMRSTVRDLNIAQRTHLSLDDIAKKLNPLLRGWIGYYGRYASSQLEPMLRHVNLTIRRWAMRKFKRFKGHKIRTSQFLQRVVKDHVSLFVHWQYSKMGAFA